MSVPLRVVGREEVLTGVPAELDDRLQELCARLRDLGNSLAGVGELLQTNPEHVNVATLAGLAEQLGPGIREICEYRRLLEELWRREEEALPAAP